MRVLAVRPPEGAVLVLKHRSAEQSWGAKRLNAEIPANMHRPSHLQRLLSLVLATTAIACAVPRCPAAEPPLSGQLEVWYEASSLTPSDSTAGGGEKAAIAEWPDRSGNGRDLHQSDQAARPSLRRIDDHVVVRFDGVDDHLRTAAAPHAADGLTLFMVAAPRSNLGIFTGLIAANAVGRRDYESGINVDLGPLPQPAFGYLNIEGNGFSGAQNLLQRPGPFGRMQTFEISVDPREQHVAVSIDGKLEGNRPWTPSPIHLDEWTLGARYYTNGPGDQQARGMAAIDVAEVLIYRRALSEAQREQVRYYLQQKYGELKQAYRSDEDEEGRVWLETVENPPPVQMMVPGFETRELPIELPNINNVRYRPDGTLVAMAYNGNIYLLSDSDGDGLEDRADLFWENTGRVIAPIGMALTPPGYSRGQGAFMATKNECLLVVDTDGDDRADEEIVVATGWQNSFHNVDALGVAVDPRDESIYFGIGTANFVDPFQRDAAGQAHYDIAGERGAILKVTPDFSTREVFSTGIRFPVGLAFNHHGDLFCTDQEGATWVPNGNPFDELLHLQKGRHYGFPARHPKFLPNVIDEPSTYDYGPQHQSTCGLIFNEPVAGGSHFGPSFWAHDALVSGYSRGKLYRTKLAKTPAGYVADNRLIATLNMLTVDSCVTPAGDLVIAVHSGGPDWGSGPSGVGKLYKVFHAVRSAPQPVAAWAATPTEVRVAFDRPVDSQSLKGLVAATEITYGSFVRAGDDLESLRPGYEVVARQMVSPRYRLAVHSAQVAADQRTLIFSTDPHPQAVWYAIRLPSLTNSAADEPQDTLPQLPRVDLDYTLGGVEASWQGEGESWSGWLPHLDLGASREFLQGSTAFESLQRQLRQAGELRLAAQLDLADMLRPAVQPGATIDYEYPPEIITVHLRSSHPFGARAAGADISATAEADGYAASVECRGDENDPLALEIMLSTGGDEPTFSVAWSTAEDDRLRPLATDRLLLPWARKSEPASDELVERAIPELDGGNWARGHKIFFSDKTLCSKCHQVNGQGGTIGPDLTNLVHRDYASVLRDVTQPSYAVNPDYITHSIITSDGRALVGTLRNEGDELLVSDSQARITRVHRDDVEQLSASTQSIMPEDLVKELGEEGLRDLLTFLLTQPPAMEFKGVGTPPPPRTHDQLSVLLAGAPEPPLETRPIRVVLVAGPKDHGPGEHDYPAWQKSWLELFGAAEGVDLSGAWEWPSEDQLKRADVLVFYQKGDWNDKRAADIDRFLNRGGGLVYLHYAVDGGARPAEFAERIGLAWQGGRSLFRHGPLQVEFEAPLDHPIARNFAKLELVDESYWNLVGDPARIDPLASGIEQGQPQPLFWTLEPLGGRVFVSIPGHYSWTFDDPLFRVLILRGIAWAAGEPVDRFNELAEPWARLESPASGAPETISP